MDYIPKEKFTVKPEISILKETYPHDVQLYKIPPTGEISLLEFQDYALERQKVLQLLELILTQQHSTLEETKLAFTNLLRKEGYYQYAKLLNAQGSDSNNEDLEARRKDHISHYVLRLAYSLEEDLQNYMLVHETEFFKLRFASMNKEDLSKFLITSGIHYSQISQEFKEQNRENLRASTVFTGDFENMDFYELPFDEVVDLINDRKVYVHRGIAYVPQSEFISVFVTHFRSNLAVELNRAKKFVVTNLSDDRLQHFIKNLPDCFSGMSKVVWSSENTPISKLNDLSKTSYPLCMRIMHEHLKTNHHLKNTGRLQYGLFLKGIGVTLDDSIEFWKSEMTKKEDINEDKFNKQYLYQIQYNYGKVGRRVNYRPPGCTKLVVDPVGPGEIHGCPFKHMDIDELTKKLIEYKISPSDIHEISKYATEGRYNLACTTYFESTHKKYPEKIFFHPNQYFEQSRLILNKNEIKEENTIQDKYAELSPENISQSAKIKVEKNINTSNSTTPSKTIERKVKTIDRKMGKMDSLNIAALLNDDSD
ncbi:PREDICTED: DNA primase large subunit-like [Ceratosolen solmsi marchali]|uniref:DNA primase large subunit n=1 Tax=Ceratosolen solmsi marchali TaxID=326594 RepID=A0AAJ6YUK4_9HYME|nr:PREDICTED: DNA primase large subunit-like [Ceratosolen solmsi marchali]